MHYIADHYKFVLSYAFDRNHFKHAILVEEDMIVSSDFLKVSLCVYVCVVYYMYIFFVCMCVCVLCMHICLHERACIRIFMQFWWRRT